MPGGSISFIKVARSPPRRAVAVMAPGATCTESVEAHRARDDSHPLPHTERGISGAQHRCAEAQQAFQCVGEGSLAVARRCARRVFSVSG
jgi:hypothetical protein